MSNGHSGDKEPKVSPPKPGEALDEDLQHLVDAGTRLVGASVRPLVRALDVLGDRLDPARPAKLRLSPVGEAGADLVMASVRFVEKLANATLGALSPPRGDEGELGSLAPGGEKRFSLCVENPSDKPMSGLEPKLISLAGPGGAFANVIVSFEPSKLDVGPKDFEKLNLVVRAPEDAALGVYAGEIGLGGAGAESIGIRFRVMKG
ncbi:MAG: hypothetical protein HUU21_11675 [Polyangiaceae bacterium]|nr:hypothetical protein [Polyangiaceae bacterium]